MNRRLWLVMGGAGVLGAAVFGAYALRPQLPEEDQPARVHFSELPPAVYRRGEYIGRSVQVAFYRPLTPTADPLVWLFHPGEPASVVPATYRLHFDTPPPSNSPPPAIVVGVVQGIDPDLLIRLNAVPGVVVLRSCRALPVSPASR